MDPIIETLQFTFHLPMVNEHDLCFSLHSNYAAVVMPRVRSRNAYQHVFDFDKGRLVANRNCGLSYPSIAARVGRDPMTISRI
ncbi:hypothetical protein TNCV_2187451 [Trichonephila clavipes]|nr:hypothetical protein TNCV_2187451 [Trichonephila clavipes]